jgi:hypothetical protein
METRMCSSCGESKSVAGIWYLVGEGSDGFMCGACFSRTNGRVDPEAGVVQQQ